MSAQQHPNAELPGHQGPYFPEAVTELRRRLDVRAPAPAPGFTGAQLELMWRGLPGFVSKKGYETTTDDYTWFWCFTFARDGWQVIVAIPWSQDQDKRDGTQADRSIAVYYSGPAGEPDPDMLSGLIREMAEAVPES